MNIFEITLDVDKRANKESVNLRQGDINGTTIKATLRDHDEPMEGGEYTAAFCMTLPDRKTYYWTEATYEDGVVSVVVDEQYAANVPGVTNNAYFELYEGDELKYTTASFIVRIKASAMDGEAAGSYDSRVEAVMDEMRTLIEEETEAEEDRAEAEAARVEAEELRAASEQERANTFTVNEAARDETFTANEGRRAAAYAETEGARSKMFLEHEGERSETFETNEAERAATFADNEAERQSTFDENEEQRKELFANFATPTVSIEETSTGQVAHIAWKDSDGVHVSDMVIDDAINITMTGDTFSVPVDPDGFCVESGTARFYFSGWVGDRMVPCTASVTSSDSRFSVRITNATAREQGLVRIDYRAGEEYPVQAAACALSLSCGGRVFTHRLTAIAPRGGSAADAYTHESFAQFCAALVNAFGWSVSETWNESLHRYEYDVTA